MRDYSFEPTPVVLVPGETVRFTVFNAGLEVHDFVIGDAEVQQAWSIADAAATPPNLFATAPPASVPPEPTAQTKPSTLPPVSSQISGWPKKTTSNAPKLNPITNAPLAVATRGAFWRP